jgi:serine/threonine protein kinase
VTLEVPNPTRQAPDIFVYRRQVASALHHRNILATLDIGEDGGTPYVVSEYFAGDTLRSIINSEAPFDVDDVAILIEQLAQGLTYAHNRGIVHGSLSPDTIIVDSSGLAKITSFGMIEGQMVSESGSRAALPPDAYLPPNLRGNSLITRALDVHALAAIAFEMLTGARPAPDQGFVTPTVLNPQVPPRAGDTILIGLRAFEDRSGLTANQLSHALTNWRSWAMQQSPTRPHIPAASHTSALPAAPLPPAFTWPDASESPLQRVSAPAQRRPAVLRWLAAGVLVLAIATAVVLTRAGEDGALAGVVDIPAELTQMISALSS